MRLFIIPTVAAIVIGVGSIPASAFPGTAHPVVTGSVSDVTLVQTARRRPYYHVRVPRYQQPRVPRHLRGFEDPGYAYHGNINGCVVDLGYGRWESCNVGR